MPDTTSCETLADTLVELWAKQGRDGFLLSDPATAQSEAREVLDAECGVSYRYLWMPHREMRGDVQELQRRGILNPDRDESKLFRDDRDPSGRHCFLCADNVAECHPMEVLTPLELAGLLSLEPLERLIPQLEAVNQAAASLGCSLKEPFMQLSFLSLAVIPELKLTDMGLVDVNRFELVNLFVSD